MIRSKILLIIILILAAVLRLAALDKYPSGLNADEAAIGYNAYSLIQTGKDEYGTSWPLVFKSFGDYKPGLYFYFTIPFVAVLGLTELAVRLPSAILGIICVYLIYLIGKEIFNKKIGLISAFLLSITPWHLHFSRGGWESNASTTFFVLAILFLLKGLKKNIFFFWSLVCFLISMYLYQSPRLLVPVFLLGASLIYYRYFWGFLKKRIIYLIVVTVLAIPLAAQFLFSGGTSRFSGLSFYSDLGPYNRTNELRGEHQDLNEPLVKITHNKLTAYGPNLLGHYLDHFRPDFLFVSGDEIIRNKSPESGQFYLIQSLLLIMGIIFLMTRKSEFVRILLLWVLVSPLASSSTFQTPNALRSLNLVVPLILVMAYGLSCFLETLKKYWRYLAVFLISIILTFELIHYLESYYIHYPKRTPIAWEYGFKEMVEKLDKYQSNFDKIIITDRYDQPYILVLFYKKYDPEKYQPQAMLTTRDKFNFGTVRGFDNYEFRAIDPNELSSSDNRVLFVGTEAEIPDNAQVFDKVLDPMGNPIFLFARVR